MLKDCNVDPLLASINENDNGPVSNSIFGHVDFQNSPNHALSINKCQFKTTTSANSINSPASHSSHKVVTPLRQQNTSSLVASLESISSDSKGVTEHIAKITSTFVSPASNLVNSFATLSTLDTLSDPTLLQSHVQKSLETSSFGFDSPFDSILRSSTANSNNTMKNSLYNTPIRCKQSKSHDFSELPSQRRRRSSIISIQEDLLENMGMGEVPLSDLSHFKDNEDDESNVIPIDFNMMKENVIESNGNNFNYFDDTSDDDISDDSDFIEKEISPLKLSTKRQRSLIEPRAFTLPSTAEYQDGSKPPFSYASLIAQAIISSPKQRLALSNIYCWIMDTYPYYKLQTCGWQVHEDCFYIYTFMLITITIIVVLFLEFYKT